MFHTAICIWTCITERICIKLVIVQVMPGTTQPTEIDEAEYEAFRQFVKDIHGSVRGNLRTELENALREYRTKDRDDRLRRIEDDIATLVATVAEPGTDGGSVAPTQPVQTGKCAPAPDAPGEKPAPNQPRGRKADWMAAKLEAEKDATTKENLRGDIQGWYDFTDDTTDDYVDAVLDRIDYEPSPVNPDILVLDDDKLAEHRQQAEQRVADQMDDVTTHDTQG